MRYGLLLAIPLFLVGCAGQFDGTDAQVTLDSPTYDEAQLERFKKALPSRSRLTAKTPQEAANAAGDAVLPNFAVGPAHAINVYSVAMLDVIDAIVQYPPTLYSEEEQKFMWGPGPNGDSYGNAALYIQENPEGSDFQFTYAFVRLPEDNNWDEAVAVIWGAATPDPDNEDKGVGVTLYDFDASHYFDMNSDPAYDASLPRSTGRFVALYGSQEDEGGEFLFNVAILRNLMPEEGTETGMPINLNYLFGEATGVDGNTLTFLDWEQLDEICDANRQCFDDFDPEVGSGAEGIDGLEVLTIHMAFVNRGMGRAEGVVAMGDLGDPESGQVVGYAECWNEVVEQTQFVIDPDLNDAEPPIALVPGGTCVEPFGMSLPELGIPSLDDLRADDPDLIPSMECVALHGVPGCEQCIEENDGDLEACR